MPCNPLLPSMSRKSLVMQHSITNAGRKARWMTKLWVSFSRVMNSSTFKIKHGHDVPFVQLKLSRLIVLITSSPFHS